MLSNICSTCNNVVSATHFWGSVTRRPKKGNPRWHHNAAYMWKLYNYCRFQVEYVNLLTRERIIPRGASRVEWLLSRVNKFTYSTRNVQLLFYHNENPTQQAPDVVAILYQNRFHIDSTKLVGINVESMLIKCWVPAGYVRQNEKKYWEQSRSHHFQWWLKERPYICQF